MFGLDQRAKSTRRRAAIRDNRPDCHGWFVTLRERGALPSIGVAFCFCVALLWLFMLRPEIVNYRPGQYVPHDITARADFQFFDADLHNQQVNFARDHAPRVYRQLPGDAWGQLQSELLALPDYVHGLNPIQLDEPFRDILDGGSITQLEQDRTGPDRQQYDDNVRQFITYARQHLTTNGQPLVVLAAEDYAHETSGLSLGQHRQIYLEPLTQTPVPGARIVPPDSAITKLDDVASDTIGANLPLRDSTLARLQESARGFELDLGTKIARIAAIRLTQHPNYELDDSLTQQKQNEAANSVDPAAAVTVYPHDTPIVFGRTFLSDHDWQVLRQENEAYHQSLTDQRMKIWQYRAGLAGVAIVLTVVLSLYVARFQPRCIRNHSRATAIAALLIAMLLVTQLAGIGSLSLYFFGIAPTILAAMILTIGYEQRFAMGVATIHALIVTAALDQDLGFFMILWSGVLTSCYLLDDIRTRSKLIEVGGLAALAMIIVTSAVDAINMQPAPYIAYDCLYAGAAGLAAGFVVLGILPFIEKIFRITTSMTLLELADASQPLLRRLALEAPGTYNHSLQVATLAEAAAEAIGANSLLCRVGSYYHDVGKINKPDYFVENQMGGENRHLNLSPTLSLRIILSHVKDGVELAREYNLPTSLFPIIQQHHGTTLVEYFYKQAISQNERLPDSGPRPSDTEFRYDGPKPRSKEAAIVMMCDCVESACRCLSEPNASRMESLVHKLATDRLQDGQFDDSDLTLRDLEEIEKSLIKTLLGIYHGRITYPSTAEASAPLSSVKLA